ncbi:TPA: hypothetical protein ACHV3E_000817 [Klebsiella pneumoniae]|uniref:hypothetical protein n=1 Tax=Klebsiella pneumoniae TaxID=573 RepID=UPI000E2DEDAF|nr:hypothetical protein [Klebsiella pneumoniae]MCQ0614295.1 hypothetical protein [Klebsiella pneumoniae]MCX2309275.1 hypothetical protein [Klebsiella pneumoniae]MEC4424514.1 hypothetical protein [Klebsiella pneumoniae]MEC4434577.1 hypothetical protein [Klebsiella pneumoniae]SVX86201.1 Uncharacterised protein [Klebsiella pneumoniae]
MNIETVNELIRSLESAGELSIKEQKVLKLAKAYQQLAAENVQIKAMNDCLSEELRGYESDGAFEGPKMHLLWWQVETPATDRIVAGIKADEEKAALNDLLRHLDKIDIENLSSPWELSSEVVAFVNSRLLREGADK